jgi:hypothetical protein
MISKNPTKIKRARENHSGSTHAPPQKIPTFFNQNCSKQQRPQQIKLNTPIPMKEKRLF